MSDHKKPTSHISVRVKHETVEAIDAYRRAQDLIPSRADAIEALIDLGFLSLKKHHDQQKEKTNGETR